MNFKGSMVALVTPFKNGQVDLATLEKLIEFQLEEGTDGLVLCGTTGESPTLSENEQASIIQLAVKRAGGSCPIIAGTGTNATQKSMYLSEQARDLGADGLMLVTPYYNKPTQAGLYEHFGTVASGVLLPIIMYNIPGRCGVEISQDTIIKLFNDFDNITTVKHATGSVMGAASLHQACDIAILSGDDPLTLPLMAVGAAGVISVVANLLPKKVKTLTDAFLAGDFSAARAAHEELLPLSESLLSLETNPIPIKTAMAIKGMIEEEFRLPICKMQPKNKEKLKSILTSYCLL